MNEMKKAAPAAVAVADEREAFEKWLGIKPCGSAHDFGWAAWQARAALAATPAAGPVAKGYDSGIQTGNRVTLIFETQDAATAWFESFSDAYDAENGTRSIALPIPISTTPAAAPVVLPEPSGTLHCNDECYVWARATDAGKRMRFEQPIALYTEQQVRALLAQAAIAAAPAHPAEGVQAVEQGEVLVTVSGFLSGKTVGKDEAAAATGGQAQANSVIDFPHEEVDALAITRYKVVAADKSMFWESAVVAGDGTRQLYTGRKIECENMARKFAGAFAEGAFVFHAMHAPQAQKDQA